MHMQRKKPQVSNGRPFTAETATYPYLGRGRHKSLQRAREVFCFVLYTYIRRKKAQVSNGRPFAAEAASYRDNLERGNHESLHVTQNKPSTRQLFNNPKPSLSISTEQRSKNVQINPTETQKVLSQRPKAHV